MKDIKHIRRDFHSVAWVMPQGSDLGVRWGVEWSKKKFPEIQPDLVCELLTSIALATTQFFGSPPPGEGSNIKKSESQSQFQRFLSQTLCIFSQMKDIKHIRRYFHSVPWVMYAPGFGTWECWGGQKLIF